MAVPSSSQLARFAAAQPVLAAASIQAGYGRAEWMGSAALCLAAAMAEWLAERAGGPLPRVFDLGPWQGARACDLDRGALDAIGSLEWTLYPLSDADRAAVIDAAAPVLLALARAAADVPPRPSPRWPGWAAAAIRRGRAWLSPERDDAVLLPRRLAGRVWLLTLFSVVSVYLFMWSVVHVIADCRPCLGQLDDPLHHWIPLDGRWSVVSHELYVAVILTTIGAMIAVAALGDHRPVVRWGMALAVVALLRSATVWLVPLCRVGVEAGTVRLREIPWVEVGPLRVAWRAFASNDLLFSGHMAECILALRATRSWPRVVRAAMWMFLVAQTYALLATRGHYTIDLLVAVPMAFFADFVAVRSIGRLSAPRVARATSGRGRGGRWAGGASRGTRRARGAWATAFRSSSTP